MRHFGNYLRLLTLPVCIGLTLYACVGVPAQVSNSLVSQSQPEWINSPYSKYDNRLYVAETGSARSDEEAKRRALVNLVRYFGQTIQADQTISTIYIEAVKNGVSTVLADSTVLEDNISVYAANTLIGAEVSDTWYDNKMNTWYALAVMDKAKSERIYTDMIKANLALIDNLVNMNQVEKNTIEGFSRYYFAAVTADINDSFGNVLKVIGAAVPAGLKNGDECRLEALNIAKNIPVNIAVEKRVGVDRAGVIRNAFSGALSEIGFRITPNNAPYTLEVNIDLREVNYPDRQTEFVRNEVNAQFAHYEISADFTDSASKMGLLPIYMINGQTAQTTLQEAENRAITAAEQKIKQQYKDWLLEHLSQRLSRK